MRKVILLLLMLGFFVAAQAQNDTIKNWKLKGKASLNINQNYFSNWAAGRGNNFGLIGKYTMNADYVKGKNSWINWLDIVIGYSIIGKADPTKTDDKIELISTYKRQLAKNVNLATKLDLFSNYLHKPQNIVVDWQTEPCMKVDDWLNVTIFTTVLYDDRIMITDKNGNTGPRTQFKQLLRI